MHFNDIEKSVLGISSRTLSTAVIGGLGTYYLIPGSQGSFEVMGYSVPLWLLYGGVFGVAGGGAEAVKGFMKKNTPSTAWLYEFSPVAVGITASATMYAVSLLLGGNFKPSINQLLIPFGVGAASDYSAMLLTDTLINPLMDIKKVSDVGKSLLPEAHILENFPISLNKIWDTQLLL